MWKSTIFPILSLSISLSLFLPAQGFAGQFRVIPIKLVLDKQFKNGIINIMNVDLEPVQVQMTAREWTQDAEGKDQYTDTKDLIFFPKIMSIKGKEKRLIRVGIKTPAISAEKTYRIFIEEIEPSKKPKDGAQIKFKIRFGVPIFVKPLVEEIKGEIEKISYGDNKIKVDVRNTGNSHFMIQSITVKGLDTEGSETFSTELSGWYLLAGATRPHETPLSQEVCSDTAKIDVEVKANQFELHDQLDVIKTLCMP